MSSTKAPSFLKPCDKVNEFWVVPKLWINHLNILRVSVEEQRLQVVEASLNVLTELSRSCTLVGADLPAYVISDNKH